MSKRRADGKFAKGNPGGPGRPKKKREDSKQYNADGWANPLTGLALRQRDKRESAVVQAPHEITWKDAEDLWRGNDLAARIVETWPKEMLREGYELMIHTDEGQLDKARQEAIQARSEEIGLDAALLDAMFAENAYGGALAVLGVDDGQEDLTQPLNEQAVRSFDWITVIEARDAYPTHVYNNPRLPKYGQPAIFRVNPVTTGGAPIDPEAESKAMGIHETRCLVFPGIRVSRTQHSRDRWGDSVLTRVHPVLRDFDQSWGSTSALLQDFAQAIFKIKGLAEIIAQDGTAALQNRMIALDMSRSVVRAALLDADGEDFERKPTPITGLPELLDRFASRLAAAANMPLTLLMGQSPAGLNATGESDIRFFYDRVAAEQKRRLLPHLDYVFKLLFLANGGEPENWGIEFCPLWQPTDKEMAEARKLQAETDAIYSDLGVLSASELTMSRFGGDKYSFETNVDLTVEREEEIVKDEPEPPPMIQPSGLATVTTELPDEDNEE